MWLAEVVSAQPLRDPNDLRRKPFVASRSRNTAPHKGSGRFPITQARPALAAFMDYEMGSMAPRDD